MHRDFAEGPKSGISVARTSSVAYPWVSFLFIYQKVSSPARPSLLPLNLTCTKRDCDGPGTRKSSRAGRELSGFGSSLAFSCTRL